MRVLLDENLPHDLAELPTGHEAETVAGRGWAGVSNGELLGLAAADYGALLTMDRRLPQQHQIDGLTLAIILIVAPTNRMTHLRPLVPDVLQALSSTQPGSVVVVTA